MATKTTTGKAKKTRPQPAPRTGPVLTLERERALLECYRVIYRAELVAE